MQAARLAVRLQREMTMFQKDPPPGVCIWSSEDSLTRFEAQMQGPGGTVYEAGMFKLDINVPERYPFEPPNIRFKTPIYHPNIDNGGRICLDILTMPPKGAWRPSLNISTLLSSIGLLLMEPNPDDGLMVDITDEYKHHRSTFDLKAKRWTDLYARQIETGSELPRNIVNLQNVEDPGIGHRTEVGSKFPVDRSHMADARTGCPQNESIYMASPGFSEKIGPASNCAADSQPIHSGKGSLSSLKLSLEKPTGCGERNNIPLHQSANVTLHLQHFEDRNIVPGPDRAQQLNQSASNDDICNKLWTKKNNEGSAHQKSKLLPIVESVFVGSNQGGPVSHSAKVHNCVEVVNVPSVLADHEADTKISVEASAKSSPAPPTCIPEKSQVSGKYKTLQLSRVKDPNKHFEIISGSDCNKKVAQADASSSIINEETSRIAECVIVSDSESDEEPRNKRCRLSLTKIGLAKKRRAGLR